MPETAFTLTWLFLKGHNQGGEPQLLGSMGRLQVLV